MTDVSENDETRGPVVRDVPAVTRASALLRVLAHADEPIGVVALAREIEAIPSTCLHILRVLVYKGLASFDPATKRYSLGPGVLSLASRFAQRNPFAQFARPFLESLSHANRLAFAAIERSDQDHLVVVAVGDATAGVAVRLTAGTRLPVVMSASGRCFAAFEGHLKEDLKRRFAKLRWDDPPSFDMWVKQIEQTRTSGFALDPGNYIRGISVVSVPVFFAQGEIAGCLTGVDFKDRLVNERLAAVVQSMKEAAAELSRKLGG